MVGVIEHRDAEGLRRGIAETGFSRGVFKCSVAAIVPETNGRSFVGFRRAVRFALAIERAVQVRLRRPLDIIADDQVEMAVLVVIEPRGAGAEFLRPSQARFLRKDRKSTRLNSSHPSI